MKTMGMAALWVALGTSAWGQDKPAPKTDKGNAYYNYAMGHIYGELAGAYGNRGEYVNKAIDHLRQALKSDPAAGFLAEELADFYIQSNRLREGVLDAETVLRDNPKDNNARRILGRIYLRLIGDTQRGAVNEDMLKRATEQYAKIVEQEPGDGESWLVLGRLHSVGNNSIEAQKSFEKSLTIVPDNEEALSGLAGVYARLGDHRKAAEYLKKITEKSPNPRTLLALAENYEQMRDFELAAETLKQALAQSPGNTEIKRSLAQNLTMANKLDDALAIFKELVADDARDVQSQLRISQIYRQKNQVTEARKASEEAKKLAPDSIEVIYNEVGLLEAEGKAAEAIASMKEVLDKTAKRSYNDAEKNNRAMLLERLGQMYRNNEQFKEALEAFREFTALDPALVSRGTAHIVDTHRQAHEFQKSLEEADAALKKWPEDRVIRLVRASVLAELGKVNEGASEVKKLMKGDDGDRELWITTAQLYEKGRKLGDMAKAIDEAEKLSKTSEEKETIAFMRGAMYEKMKKPEESEKEFRKVLAANPTSASALNYLGYMLADRNVRLNEALEMIKKAVDQEPYNGAYLDSLGWVYFRLGRLDEAEENLRKAKERTSKDPTINDHLGDVYQAKGKLKEAVQQWEQAVSLWNASSPSDLDPSEVSKIHKKLENAKVRLAKEAKAQKNDR